MAWRTLLVSEAVREIESLAGREREAIENAVKKLQALGPQLGYPHSSAIRGSEDLRELRPRAGRSRWRVLYRQIGEVYLVAAIGPEAGVDPRGFDRAVAAAKRRLDELEVD
ncbi:MAG TPA: type II toxin-antitoxin system RelE/ParE family toxin [Mycobacteriales bacterium]|nr:type II toxin-antitoxin system RelE/ParE family toxin [Mycobacteriales bacterium]